MSETKLKPCPNPWCESKAEYVEERGIWFIVVCEYCGNRGPARKSREDAIAAWNTRPAPALTPKQAAADTPEKMRERCFHDFLRLIQACMAEIDEDDVCVLQTFKGFVERYGIPGLGTGTCDCGADDCPYKTASVPCDCGLPDCTDPRIAAAQSLADEVKEAADMVTHITGKIREAESKQEQDNDPAAWAELAQYTRNGMLASWRDEFAAVLAAWEKLK